MRQIIVTIIFALFLVSAISAEEDVFKPLFSKIEMDAGPGLRIKVPALEDKLKQGTAAFWLKGLTDIRPLSKLRDEDGVKGLQEAHQEGEEPFEWRVCDVVYFFYERLLLPGDKRELTQNRFTQAERNKFIERAIKDLKSKNPTDVPLQLEK